MTSAATSGGSGKQTIGARVNNDAAAMTSAATSGGVGKEGGGRKNKEVPVERKTLLFRAEVFNVRRRVWEWVKVLADSASEAQMCTEDYYAEQTPAIIKITGVNSTSERTSIGCVFVRVPAGQEQPRVLRLPMTTTTAISSGHAHLLLHASTCRMMGLLQHDVHASTVDLQQLPLLPLYHNDEWSREREVTNVPGSGQSVEDMILEASVAVADANVAKILEDSDDDPFGVTPYSLDNITWGCSASQADIDESGLKGVLTGGVFTLQQVRRLKNLCLEHKEAFATGKIPHANKREPVVVELMPDAPGARPSRPVHCPQPQWPPHTRRYLNKLREFWLSGGMSKPNPFGEWATRVGTIGRGQEDDQQWYKALRVPADDRPINKRAVPYMYTMPDGPAAVERASRKCRYSFSTDANAAFNAFRIHEDSQKYFTVWLPNGDDPTSGAGKYQMTRLGFGFRNSPAIMIDWYDQLRESMSQEARDALAAYFDDFKLNSPYTDDWEDDFEVFFRCLLNFLVACKQFDVELGPPKSRGGFEETTFFGVRVYNSGGSSLSASRVETIKQLPYPTNVKELRQVLGLLTQMRKWVDMYSTMSHSLSHLLKAGVEWNFGTVQKKDFDALRNALITSTLNYAPDYAHELILSTDASDYAIGSRLFQTIAGADYNIGFWSRTLTLSEQKMAVYFRELLGVLEGIKRARIYALSSPLPLRVQTDQKSLIFVDSLAKGPLSHHHLAAVADVNYNIEYIKGELNHDPDTLTRYGLMAPRALSVGGMIAALDTLLEAIGDSHRDDNTIWVTATVNTVEVARVVQQWRRPTNKISTGPVDEEMLSENWTFAIVVPKALTAPQICATLLASGKHFACLIPLDLLSVVPMRHDGTHDAGIYGLLRAATKVVMPAANFCWIVGGLNFANVVSLAANCLPMSAVMSSDALREPDTLPTRTLRERLSALHESAKGPKATLVARLKKRLRADISSPLATVREESNDDVSATDDVVPTEHRTAQYLSAMEPLIEWAKLQKDTDCPAANRVFDNQGVMKYDPGDGPTCYVVPAAKRLELMQLIHKSLGHNVDTTLSEIKRAYWWTNMTTDVRKFMDQCVHCNINKNRIQHAHGLWRAVQYDQPRQTYAMDIKKLGSGENVYFCLAVVDKFSNWLTLCRLTDKTTTSVIRALYSYIIWKFGFFSALSVDSEKSFYSQGMKAWATGLGIVIKPPLGYAPTSNSAAEVIWKHVEQAVKGDETFPPSAQRLDEIAFEWNTQCKGSTNLTPFMIQFGTAPTTAGMQFATASAASSRRTATEAEVVESATQTALDAAAIRSVAANRSNNARRVRAADLNRASKGHLPALEIGSKSFVYQPASGAVVNARGGGRNRTFVSSFTGPATITARLSLTGYELVDDVTGTHYRRHRQHLRPIPVVSDSL